MLSSQRQRRFPHHLNIIATLQIPRAIWIKPLQSSKDAMIGGIYGKRLLQLNAVCFTTSVKSQV